MLACFLVSMPRRIAILKGCPETTTAYVTSSTPWGVMPLLCRNGRLAGGWTVVIPSQNVEESPKAVPSTGHYLCQSGGVLFGAGGVWFGVSE